MKIKCDVIQDLLPLYAENIASQGSKEMVEEHIQDCEVCKMELDKIKQPDIKVRKSDWDQVNHFAKKFKKHILNIILLSVSVTVGVIALISGLFFLKPGEEIGYVILYFYLIIPFTAFVCSLLLGMRRTKLKYIAPVLFGSFGLIVPTIIFNYFNWFALGFGFCPSLIGLIIGQIIYSLRGNRRN